MPTQLLEGLQRSAEVARLPYDLGLSGRGGYGHRWASEATSTQGS